MTSPEAVEFLAFVKGLTHSGCPLSAYWHGPHIVVKIDPAACEARGIGFPDDWLAVVPVGSTIAEAKGIVESSGLVA